MGTPCCYGMKKNGIIKSTYNHYSGGIKVFGKRFLKEIQFFSLAHFSNLFDKIQMVNLNSTPSPEQIKYCKNHNWFDNTVDDRKDTNWYCLLKNTMGSFKELFRVEEETPLMINYPIDGYCYGYLIDFDIQQFLVYYYGKLAAIIPLEYIENTNVDKLVECLELQISDSSFIQVWEDVFKE